MDMSDQNAEVLLAKFYDELPPGASVVMTRVLGSYTLSMYHIVSGDRVVHVDADSMLEMMYLGRSRWDAYQRTVTA